MSDSYRESFRRRSPVREPMFNVAPVVAGVAAALLLVHLVRSFVLSSANDAWVIFAFAFIPARELTQVSLASVPGGELARLWSPLTYAALHADWSHVLVNDFWLVAFGSPLAWRFGTVRFLLFSAVGAIAGALAHFALYPDDTLPLVGASAAISAHMAGVSRFAFTSGVPAFFGARGPAAYRMPAPPLLDSLKNPRVLTFIGAWFVVNLIFGISGAGTGLASGAIAWDAHVGGFLAGLLLFSVFDRA